MKWLNKLWRILEEGYAKMTYTDLYSKGVMTQKEYLKIMDELEDKKQ